MCTPLRFRVRMIGIGAEGQIAVGGIAAIWIALNVQMPLPAILLAGIGRSSRMPAAIGVPFVRS